ncbi:crotonase/enoyl-CoA hydratase family protein [Variovorax sp. PBL-E5]|uniref:crotonase/enoyl-CoA hydratase family protein n=1 Tax=Variovorax sp. PBL-E5 TaxID=434014 RepID=UPI001319954E|nr:crotonase/enoyl-CoA hydratase family protein [Variovorax sp. PBL-E5]VTU46039.1 2,3-dehydroadipyl-CoA hydratase [Variovorax sp. PBL-E5]
MAKWIKSSDFIAFAVERKVARITLNRPDKRNALHEPMMVELHAALLEADDLVDVNVIVLDGAGKDFCAGYDFSNVYSGGVDADKAAEAARYRSVGDTLDDDAWQLERTQALTAVLFDIHKPVIAKVHGNCLAGGTDLALMCDMVIASEDARIGFPATRANGTAPNNMWFYHVGPQWAKRLLLSGDCVWGRDAARIGLVMDAVPADRLDAAVDELANRLGFVDHELLTTQKRIVNIAMELAGARSLQRMAVEMNARSHTANGPRRAQFASDLTQHGLKVALRNRDEPFGDGMVTLHAAAGRSAGESV